MKKYGTALVFLLYLAVVGAFCVTRYIRYTESFEELQPYEHDFSLSAPDETISLDLNKATASQLVKLPGISRPLADAIVTYRKEIGGFTSLRQLRDVPNMTEALYLALGEYLYLEVAIETKASAAATIFTTTAMPTTETIQETEPTTQLYLDLNTATFEELCLIPEIGEVTAAAIIEYRSSIGQFINRKQLLNVKGIGETTLSQIAGYLYITDEQPYEITEEPLHEEIPEPPIYTEPPDPVEEIIPDTTSFEDIPIINLNTATAEQLMMLPNCDETLAANILSLRDGIHEFTNILEVYYAEGMTVELYLLWEPKLAVDDEGNTQKKKPAFE